MHGDGNAAILQWAMSAQSGDGDRHLAIAFSKIFKHVQYWITIRFWTAMQGDAG